LAHEKKVGAWRGKRSSVLATGGGRALRGSAKKTSREYSEKVQQKTRSVGNCE